VTLSSTTLALNSPAPPRTSWNRSWPPTSPRPRAKRSPSRWASRSPRFGIDTVIVVPGAFTQGTEHFAHTTGPAEPAVTTQYGDLAATVAGIPARLEAIDVSHQGHTAEVGSVGDALVAVLGPAVRAHGGWSSTPSARASKASTRSGPSVSGPSSPPWASTTCSTCQTGPKQRDHVMSDTTTLETNVPDPLHQLVETFYRAFSGDTDLLDKVVAPDWEDIPLSPGQGPGPDGIKPMIHGIGRSFTDFHIVVHDVIDGRGADGNGTIGVRAEMRGTHTGDMFGIPGTDRTVTIPIHEFHLVQEGRLARTWHLEDWFGFFNQIGHALLIGQDNQ